MVHVRSAVAGAAATVAVAGLVFTAVAVSNAQEPAPVADVPSVAVVGHYSTVESQDPIVYVPEPVIQPEPVVVPEPAPVVTEEAPVVKPAPAPILVPEPAQTFDAPEPEAPGMPNPMPPGLPPGEPINMGD